MRRRVLLLVVMSRKRTTRPSSLLPFLAFCFLFWFKPSEPFLVPHLVGNKGFSIREVNDDIFPTYVYAFFFWTVLSGPVGSKLGSRFVLRVGCSCEFIVRWMLIYGESIRSMRVMQVLFGATIASFPFAFSYGVEMLDNNDDDEDDEEVNDETSDDEKHNGDQTGYISATFAVSYALAGMIGQCAVSFGVTETKTAEDRIGELFWVSLVSVGLAVMVAFFVLPDVSGKHGGSDARRRRSTGRSARWSLRETAETIKLSYSDIGARCLSIYWVVASAGLNFVQTYGSNSWYETDADSGLDNGYFVFVAQVSVAIVSLFARVRVVSEDFGNRPGFYTLCSLFGFVAALLLGRWGSAPFKNVGGSKVIAMFVFYVILTSAVNLGLLVCYARASTCISNGFERKREEEKKKRLIGTPEAIQNVENSMDNDSENDNYHSTQSFSSVKEKSAIRMLFGVNGIFAAFTLCMMEAATRGDSAKTLVRMGAAFIQIGALINGITTRLVGLKNGYTFSKVEENERRRKEERNGYEIELNDVSQQQQQQQEQQWRRS